VTRAFSFATALVILVGASACGGGGSKSAATTTVTKTLTTTNPTGTAGVSVTTHGRYKYPEAVTKNYMQSCEQSSVTRAYCACTLDKLSDTVSTGDFARIGLSGGTIPPRIRRLIRQAALACKDKL
jgi:hypothetical protein